MFIDSHCHLDGARFDPDREQVIARARDAGIVNILAVGTGDGPGTLDCAVKISEQHEMVYATVGIHPHEAKLAADADFTELEQLARRPKVIAWGEIGLDYFYDHSPRDTQKTVFIRQMELARSAKLPIVIHCRPSENTDDAWDDCLAAQEKCRVFVFKFQALFGALRQKFGHARFLHETVIAAHAIDDLRRQFEVNLVGHVAVTQGFLPLIRAARGQPHHQGDQCLRRPVWARWAQHRARHLLNHDREPVHVDRCARRPAPRGVADATLA